MPRGSAPNTAHAQAKNLLIVLRRVFNLCAVLCALYTLLDAPFPACADGGFVRASQRAGPFVVTVFTSPTPLRAGLADISIMVQDADTQTPVLDAAVSVALQRVADGATPITAAATRAQATNKLLYAALVELPAAGRFALAVSVRRNTQQARVDVELDVTPPVSPILSFWPYFAVPPLAIALFVVHQRLKRRQP